MKKYFFCILIFCGCSKTPENINPTVKISISTDAVIEIISTTAKSGGNISADGGATVTARGVIWATSQNPTIALSTKTNNGTGTGAFTSALNSLAANSTYYVRAYATNSAGTAYGNEATFKTSTVVPNAGVTDLCGKTYKEIIIGNQTWISENLSTCKYRNGDQIPHVKDDAI